MRSASATSSGESRSMVLVVTRSNAGLREEVGGWGLEVGTCPASNLQPPTSVRDAVDDVVDAVLVRFVVQIDRGEAGIGELPVLADVAVHVGDGDQPLARIVVLEDPPVGEHHRLV